MRYKAALLNYSVHAAFYKMLEIIYIKIYAYK